MRKTTFKIKNKISLSEEEIHRMKSYLDIDIASIEFDHAHQQLHIYHLCNNEKLSYRFEKLQFEIAIVSINKVHNK